MKIQIVSVMEQVQCRVGELAKRMPIIQSLNMQREKVSLLFMMAMGVTKLLNIVPSNYLSFSRQMKISRRETTGKP